MNDLREQLQRSLGTAYTLERELGGGGMSRVFVAEETRFRRRVVIKLLSPELAAGLSAERFEREIGLAAGLQQANIVPVITAGDVDGLPWYSMPYVDGESLRARLDAGRLPAAQSLQVLSDVARALAYAHERGVVHRDIKPDNVLLSGGAAVVTDFGIAKAVSASKTRAPGGTLTVVGTSLGTPAYMAPEQAAGDDVDARADVYAWGVMAYEMLTNSHPFAGRTTAQQLMAAHIAEAPAPLVARDAGVSGRISALVMQCLEKSPAKRPQSAAELIATIDSARTGETAAPAGGRRRAMRIAVPAAVLLFAGVAVWFGVHARGGRGTDSATVAVLPFESVGPAEQAFFADGLTDAVTGKLVSVPGLTVIDRRSSSLYKATSKSAAQIGGELGVAYLVEGTVTWARDAAGQWRAQVRPRLVRTRDGATQWAGEPVVVTPTDPFSAQAEIAMKVVSELGLAIGAHDRASLASAPTNNAEAYELYLRAQTIFNDSRRGSQSSYAESIRLLTRATKLDPKFALAFAKLALRYSGLPGDSATRLYSAAISSALAIDPNLPEAHYIRGTHLWFIDARFAEGGAEVARASAAKPGDAAMLSMLGTFQIVTGQTAEGFANIERTTVLDPRDATSNADAAIFSWWFRRLDAAERHARRMVAIAPDLWSSHGHVVQVALARGDTAAARAALAAAVHATHTTLPPGTGVYWLLPAPLVAFSQQVPPADTVRRVEPARFDTVDHFAALGAWAREHGHADTARSYFAIAARSLEDGRHILTGHGINMVGLAGVRAIALAGVGRTAEARRAIAYADSIERLNALPDEPAMASGQDVIAYALLLLGDRDSALARLERLLVLPSGRTPAMLRTMWPYQSLHNDPRFQRLVAAATP